MAKITKSEKMIAKLIRHIQTTKKDVEIEIIKNDDMSIYTSQYYKRITNVTFKAEFNEKIEIEFSENKDNDSFYTLIKYEYVKGITQNIFSSYTTPSYKFIKKMIDEIDFLIHIQMNIKHKD